MSAKRIIGLLFVASNDPKRLQDLKAKAHLLLEQRGAHFTLHESSWQSLFLLHATTTSSSAPSTENSYLQGIHFYRDDPPLPEAGHYLQIILKNSSLLIRNDPVGLINLYCLLEQDATLFASSSQDLACLTSDFQLDEKGALEFLTAGYPISRRSFYRNISLLPAACEWYLTPENLSKGVEKTWYTIQTQPLLNRAQGIETLNHELTKATAAIGEIGHPRCDLTGGFDSRGILCGFLQADTRFSTVVNGPSKSPDILLAEQIAKRFALDHTHNNSQELELPQSFDDIRAILRLTDGEIEFSEYYNTCQVQQKTAQKEMLTVNGSGGELFRGYWWEGEWPKEGCKTEVNKSYLLKRILLPNQNLSIFKGGSKRIQELLEGEIKQVLGELDEHTLDGQKIDHLYLRMRMERWLARYYSATNQILPCCSPFLSAPVLSIALRLKPVLKKRNQFFRSWLATSKKNLAIIATDNGSPIIPFSLTTAHHYWRYPIKLARKIGKILGHRLGIQQPSPPPLLLDRFFQLVFSETPIPAFFDQEKMLSTTLFSHPIVSWKNKNGTDWQALGLPPSQLARIVTLELTLREIEKNRQRVKDKWINNPK